MPFPISTVRMVGASACGSPTTIELKGSWANVTFQSHSWVASKGCTRIFILLGTRRAQRMFHKQKRVRPDQITSDISDWRPSHGQTVRQRQVSSPIVIKRSLVLAEK